MCAPNSSPSTGRSPRGRGRQRDRPSEADTPGKIPARAGTTWPGRAVPAEWVEDPRAGGDDSSHRDVWETHWGRSPRGRGRPPRLRHRLRDERKIPARAGTTGSGRATSTSEREDPRAGGDDRDQVREVTRLGGRSPRGRGRRPGRRRRPVRGRKIPARAGTTFSPRRTGRGSMEDPRAGGDDHAMWP